MAQVDGEGLKPIGKSRQKRMKRDVGLRQWFYEHLWTMGRNMGGGPSTITQFLIGNFLNT